jgi:hypothetical protein
MVFSSNHISGKPTALILIPCQKKHNGPAFEVCGWSVFTFLDGQLGQLLLFIVPSGGRKSFLFMLGWVFD